MPILNLKVNTNETEITTISPTNLDTDTKKIRYTPIDGSRNNE